MHTAKNANNMGKILNNYSFDHWKPEAFTKKVYLALYIKNKVYQLKW